MSKHLARDLESLEQEILAQASVVETMIGTACRALLARRNDLVWEVLEKEGSVNQREVTIEEECLKILALHQPVAVDLRRVAAILKINSDLERIADLAVNIAERTRSLSELPELSVTSGIEEMATIAIDMVRSALDAFVGLDAEKARKVCQADDRVDELNESIITRLNDLMRQHREMVEPALHFFSATRHVERIADHATNIAEDVVYLVEGEITRHRHDEHDPG